MPGMDAVRPSYGGAANESGERGLMMNGAWM